MMRTRRHIQGHTLLIVLLALVLLATYALVSRLDANALQQKRWQHTAQSLLQAREALIAYAVTYLDNAEHNGEVFGYLPCPDRDGDGIADLTCGSSGLLAIGLLPYRTLGLPNLFDADGNCLWYAVSGRFKNNPKTRPVNWDTRSDITVQGEANPDDAVGGAVAVIIAPGMALQARANPDSLCHTDPSLTAAELPAHMESYNAATKTFVANVSTAVSHINNDRLSWVSARSITEKLVNRNDYAGFINSGIDAIAKQLQTLINTPPAADDMLPLASPFALNTFERNFYDNWRDHFRYLLCPSGSRCFTVNGASCNAVLLFGGLPDVSMNQTDWPRPLDKRVNLNYFEASAGGGLNLLNRSAMSVMGALENYPVAKNDAASWRQDVIRCLQW